LKGIAESSLKSSLKKVKEQFYNRGTITHMSREAHPDYPEFRLIKRKNVTDHRRNNPEEEGENS
jgi:hypothetical protein